MAERATQWISPLVPGDDDPRHGMNGYTNLGCRCDICREANTTYTLHMREVRRRRLERDPSIRPHGVEATYFNYMCRCAKCRAAHAEAARRRRLDARGGLS